MFFNPWRLIVHWATMRQIDQMDKYEQAQKRRQESRLDAQARIVRSKLMAKQRKNPFNVPVDLTDADRDEIICYGALYLDEKEEPRPPLDSL